jgi:hypothetical protein
MAMPGEAARTYRRLELASATTKISSSCCGKISMGAFPVPLVPISRAECFAASISLPYFADSCLNVRLERVEPEGTNSYSTGGLGVLR